MPAEARGHVRKLPSGKWQLRYYDSNDEDAVLALSVSEGGDDAR